MTLVTSIGKIGLTPLSTQHQKTLWKRHYAQNGFLKMLIRVHTPEKSDSEFLKCSRDHFKMSLNFKCFVRTEQNMFYQNF